MAFRTATGETARDLDTLHGTVYGDGPPPGPNFLTATQAFVGSPPAIDPALGRVILVTLSGVTTIPNPLNPVQGLHLQFVFSGTGSTVWGNQFATTLVGPSGPGAVGVTFDGALWQPVALNPPSGENVGLPLGGKLLDQGGFGVNIKAAPYGALGKGVRSLFGASITSGQAILTNTDGTFTQAMADGAWNVMIPTAKDSNLNALVTTVAGFTDSQHLTLALAAGATVAGAQCYVWPASGAASDDYPALVLALAAATIGEIQAPSLTNTGFYPISGQLTLSSQRLMGANKRGSAFLHTGSGTFVQTANRCGLQSLTLFAGPNTTSIWTVLDGSYGDYQDVELDGGGAVNTTKGLWLTNATANVGGCYYNRFAGINSHHSIYGLDLGDQAGAESVTVIQANTFIASQFSSNRDAGIFTQVGGANTYVGCSTEQNGKVGSGPISANYGDGIHFKNGGQASKFYGHWNEGNKNHTVRSDSYSVNDVEFYFIACTQYLADGGGTGLSSGAAASVLGRNAVLALLPNPTSSVVPIIYNTKVEAKGIITPTFGATVNVDATASELQIIGPITSSFMLVILTGATTLPQAGMRLRLKFLHDGTANAYVITWPANVKRAGGAFANTNTANAVDTLDLWYDGTNWYEEGRALACA